MHTSQPLPAISRHLKEATDWMDRYRQFWDVNLIRLDAHLKRMQQPVDNRDNANATEDDPERTEP